MAQWSISEIGRQVGIRPSALRYYEEMKVVPPARRVSGQRRYGAADLYRLTVLKRAQEAGFTLTEIRQLISGLHKETAISARWKAMSDGKITELDARIGQLQSMKDLLIGLQAGCRCESVEQCGACMLHSRREKGSKNRTNG